MSYVPWTGRIKFPGALTPETASGETEPDLNIQIIPLDSSPNQSFETTLFVDGQNIRIQLQLRYNAMAGYWAMTITDPETGAILLDSVPMVTGVYPAANILAQYPHLGLGSAYVLPVGNVDLDFPDDSTLGTEFVLAWSDTR